MSRNRAWLVALAIACVTVAGCHHNTPRSNVELELAGAKHKLLYGWVRRQGDALALELSARPVSCKQQRAPDGAASLWLLVPPGRDGHFFAGNRVGYTTIAEQGSTVVDVPHRFPTARIDAFQAQPGKRMTGSVAFDVPSKKVAARGRFDVPICSVPASRKLATPAGKVSASLAGKTHSYASAIATVGVDASGQRFVDSLLFSRDKRVSCYASAHGAASPVSIGVEPFALSVDIGGTLGKAAPLGRPLPADASLKGASASGPFLTFGDVPGPSGSPAPADGWVQFDKGDWQVGKELEGTLSIHSASNAGPQQQGLAGGHFTAKVCPKDEIKQVPSTSDVKLTVSGKTVKLAYGRARLRPEGVWISLADTADLACSAVGSDSGPTRNGGAAISFLVPPGPGSKFYVGQHVGVALHLWSPAFDRHTTQPVALWRDQAEAVMKQVQLADFSTLRGRLHAAFKYQDEVGKHQPVQPIAVDGDFSVQLCVDEPAALDALDNLPAKAPDTPLGGTIDGDPYKYKVAYASMAREKANGTDGVYSVDFFDDAHATCASPHPFLRLLLPGGGNSGAPLLRTPQPARVAGLGDHADQAWIQFDSISFKAGGKVQGRAVVQPRKSSRRHAALGGTFQATVCRTP